MNTEELQIHKRCTWDAETFYPVGLTFSVNTCCTGEPVWIMKSRTAASYHAQCSCGKMKTPARASIGKAIRTWEKMLQSAENQDPSFYFPGHYMQRHVCKDSRIKTMIYNSSKNLFDFYDADGHEVTETEWNEL